MSQSRRVFLQRASAAAAVGLVGPRWLAGQRLDVRRSADELLNDDGAELDEATVKALAHRALDAAKAAGAQFADVRIQQAREFQLIANIGLVRSVSPPKQVTLLQPGFVSTATMGVRVSIDGMWGFAGGSTLTPDEAERVARLAVGYAKGGQRLTPRTVGFAPAPVVPSGRWTTPIEIDPLTVPVGQYIAAYGDALPEVTKVSTNANLGGLRHWKRSNRVFASTEGSEIVQRTYYSDPGPFVYTTRSGDARLFVSIDVDLPMGGYGYETVAKADLKTLFRQTTEEAMRKAAMPYTSAEVGRYDVVMGGEAMASMLLPTGRALELDRALGLKANDNGASFSTVPGGTTFAMPPADILGQYKLGAPSVTITGDRSRPHAAATIGWDEEGVKPDEFALVKEGIVVDYLTTRATAPALAAWYQQQHRPLQSHGCLARTGRLQPILQLPNLSLTPGPGSTSQEELIKDVKKGVYLVKGYPAADQQQMNVQVTAQEAYEIVNGKLGRAIILVGLQFMLSRFWQNVTTLGGAASAQLYHNRVDDPDADRLDVASAYTVPALVKELNVVNLGREA